MSVQQDPRNGAEIADPDTAPPPAGREPGMKHTPTLGIALLFSAIVLFVPGRAEPGAGFRALQGFSPEANDRLEPFLHRAGNTRNRKVAVFDGDGTVLGQVPHYLADECLYLYAQAHPERKPDILRRMAGQSNVSLPYVEDRVHYFAGTGLQFLRDLGETCFQKYYPGKIYEPMRALIALLQANGFEIWIVTASPEAMYQQFLSREFRIPITNVVGVKSVVRDGLLTDEIVPPVPQDRGKKEAIETFVQERPLLVAGNSRGDKEMIEYSRDMKIIVNPDEHVAPDQPESIAEYAKREQWIIVRVRDVPEPGFPAVSSGAYGVHGNRPSDPSPSPLERDQAGSP
jgi:phosphoserine phosphatase